MRIVGAEPAAGGGVARLRLWGGVGHLAAPLAVRRAILAEHVSRPFDVVEATNWYAPAALLARRPPMALVTRNSTPAAFSRDPATRARDRFDGWAADRLEAAQARGSSHALISNTADHGRRIAAEYGLIEGDRPHAVIGLSLAPAMLARARAASYPETRDGEPIRILFVGRPEHRKGFDAILGAAEILGREADAGTLPGFAIRLAGVDAEALEPAGPGERSRFVPLGRVPEADLAREYEAAHAVLAPSRYESFGLVYQEGMAYGRPMVASNEDASARAFVGTTGAGSMARETTPAALADALRPVIRDPACATLARARAPCRRSVHTWKHWDGRRWLSTRRRSPAFSPERLKQRLASSRRPPPGTMPRRPASASRDPCALEVVVDRAVKREDAALPRPLGAARGRAR